MAEDNPGIDSSIFGAHSTHGASASAAARGVVKLEEILKAANWSSVSVFQKFYHIKQPMEGPSLIKIAWKERRTTQLMCETAFCTIIVRMAKTTSVVANYSGLYEEGEVDHINCPHPPSLEQEELIKG